jgi:hypothetical protein
MLRVYAMALLLIAFYLLLYQWANGGFVDRPDRP